MRLILRIVSGPLVGTEVVAEKNKTISVGRTKKSDLATDDNFMSSRHFAVECGTDACHVRDLKSRNGTMLNGKAVTENAVIKDGDKIAAGHSEFLVRIDSPPAPTDLDKRMMETLRPSAKATNPMVVPPPAEIPRRSEPPKQESPHNLDVFSRTADKSEAGMAESPAPSSKSKSKSISESPVKKESIPPPVVPVPPKAEPVPPKAEPVTPKAEPVTPKAEPVTPKAEPVTPKAQSRLDPEPRKPAPPVPVSPVLDAYTAATPEGRLLRLLSSQAEPLMGLLDATNDSKVLELLRNSGEEYRSIYKDEQSAAVAPYLVNLPPHSPLLKRLIHDGWGKGWGVYLTCSVPLRDLRHYFRQALMVAMPDGMELFSRFYAPAYFRTFLETSTRAEVERFFGPITTYLMEAEKPEILLEFTRSGQNVEKKGHLLSALE